MNTDLHTCARMRCCLALLAVAATCPAVLATEYHVAVTGKDTNKGTLSHPFLTIAAAATVAQPGDVITVHEGTYRERINPPRGGESDKKRIIYQAAKGEKVIIKGSEIVTDWKALGDGVWTVTLPNSFFKDYNPYQDLIYGDWFYGKGRDHHTGEVYLNGQSLFEKATLEEVLQSQPHKEAVDLEASTYTWFCESDDDSTVIWANFHDADPNENHSAKPFDVFFEEMAEMITNINTGKGCCKSDDSNYQNRSY